MKGEKVTPMKTAVMVASTVLALGLTSLAWAEEWPGTPARLGLIEGEVVVQMAGSPDWVPASSNFPLGQGDRVWVPGHGRAEVQLPAGNAVRLGDDTSLDIRAFPLVGTGVVPVKLRQGMATFTIRRLQPEFAVFQVDLPQASVQASTPSTFRADLFPDGSVQVSVHSGEVVVETPGGITEVRSRQTLQLSPDSTLQLFALAPWDEFDRWNDLRDIQLARPVNAPYLPAELTPYAPDFVAYGHWVPIPEYGYGWAPIVKAGWSPFREGRWIWWRGELVWRSDEPWGWVPFHYGRWRFYPAVGWVWIPPIATAVIWNPGAVAWISDPDFVAWVPLAPGEIYYGHRYYGPWSVNITNILVTNVHVTNVFLNASVTKAVVVVRKDAFLAGGRASASFLPPKDLFAAGGRATAGPPPLRPVTATSLPVPSRPVTMPLRSGPGSFGSALPTPQGRGVSGVGVRPPVAGVKSPAVQPEFRPRRIAPEVLLGSPPPRPPVTLTPHPAARAGGVQSMVDLRPPVLPVAPTNNRAVHPTFGPAKGGTVSSPQSRQSPPPLGQAGGR